MHETKHRIEGGERKEKEERERKEKRKKEERKKKGGGGGGGGDEMPFCTSSPSDRYVTRRSLEWMETERSAPGAEVVCKPFLSPAVPALWAS